MAIAATAALSLIRIDLAVVLVTVRLGFKLGNVLTIRVDGHVEVAGLRIDAKPGDVNKAFGLLRNINGAANDNKKAAEQSTDEGI